jgi:hypothetical protein
LGDTGDALMKRPGDGARGDQDAKACGTGRGSASDAPPSSFSSIRFIVNVTMTPSTVAIKNPYLTVVDKDPGIHGVHVVP